MSWNFRIVKQTYPKTKLRSKGTVFNIHEAHYRDNENEPHEITTNPILGPFDNLDDIEFEIKSMLKALKAVKKKKAKILKYEKFLRD
jgi:hypothetical protein